MLLKVMSREVIVSLEAFGVILAAFKLTFERTVQIMRTPMVSREVFGVEE